MLAPTTKEDLLERYLVLLEEVTNESLVRVPICRKGVGLTSLRRQISAKLDSRTDLLWYLRAMRKAHPTYFLPDLRRAAEDLIGKCSTPAELKELEILIPRLHPLRRDVALQIRSLERQAASHSRHGN